MKYAGVSRAARRGLPLVAAVAIAVLPGVGSGAMTTAAGAPIPGGQVVDDGNRAERAERHYRAAVRLLESDDRRAALGHLRYCIQLDPDHVAAHRQLGFLYYRYRGFELGDRIAGYKVAEALFDRVLELEPDDVAARYYRGRIRHVWGLHRAAEGDARAGLEVEPDNDSLRSLLASALLHRGRWSEAARLYDDLAGSGAGSSGEGRYRRWLARLLSSRPNGAATALHDLYPGGGGSGPDSPASGERGTDRGRFPADDEPSPIRLVDVAAELDLDRPSHGRGAAWADVNGDGRLDLFTTGIRDPHALYGGLSPGGFVDATDRSGLSGDPRGGWAALAGDFDNDGDADLYVTRDGWEGRGPNSLYLNDGRGRFVDRARGAGVDGLGNSFTAAAADFDRDGLLDIYVANGVTSPDGAPNALYRNVGDRGSGGAGAPTAGGRFGATGPAGAAPDAAFRDVAEAKGVAGRAPSVGTTWGDYNRDGHPDLYVANYGAANALYRNRGDGTFEEVAAEAGVSGPRYSFMTFFFDYNNDARPDLFVASWSRDLDAVLRSHLQDRVVDPERRLALFRNEGDGSFTDVTAEAGLALNVGAMSAAHADLDNDGHLDLLIGTGGPGMDRYEPDRAFWNRGDGTFGEITVSSGWGRLSKTHGIAAHDVDGDGDVDLFAAAGGQEPVDHHPDALFRNQGSTNHWLAVELVGDRSNRDAVGAQVTVRTGELLRYREVAVGVGFGATPSRVLEFGLGDHRRVDRVEIVWPSGGEQTLEDVPADRRILVTEGEDGYRRVSE